MTRIFRSHLFWAILVTALILAACMILSPHAATIDCGVVMEVGEQYVP
jgi:hypothetical protein